MASIFSLLYVSEACDDFYPLRGVDDIVATCIAWSDAVGITGVFIYSAGYFSPYLHFHGQSIMQSAWAAVFCTPHSRSHPLSDTNLSETWGLVGAMGINAHKRK